MLWLILTIATAFIWATFDVLSKFLVTSRLENPGLAAGVVSLEMFTLFAIISYFFGGTSFGLYTIIPSVFGGFAYFLANYTYYYGMARSEVSRFSPLLATNSIFIAIIAYFTIGESFNLYVYVGIILTVAGAYIISIDDPKKALTVLESKYGFLLGLSTGFLFAVRDIFVKIGTNQSSLFQVLVWFGVGGILPSLVLLASKKSELSDLNLTNLKYLLTTSVLLVAGYFVFTKAISLGPVSLASAVVKVKLLIVVTTTLMLSKFRSKILKEDFKKRILLQKFFASGLVITGLILISLYN